MKNILKILTRTHSKLPFLWVQSCKKLSAVLGTTSFRSKMTIFPRGVSAKGAVFCLATTSSQTIGFLRLTFCSVRLGDRSLLGDRRGDRSRRELRSLKRMKNN